MDEKWYIEYLKWNNFGLGNYSVGMGLFLQRKVFASAPSTFKFRLITIVSTHSQRRTQKNESEKQEINKLFSVLRLYFKVLMSRKKLLQLLLIDSTFALLKQIVITSPWKAP